MKLRSRNHLEPYLLDKYTPYQGGSAIKSGIRLPGTAGNYISTPDSVLNSVTGDIDIRVYAKLDDWTPASTNTLVSKYNGGAISFLFDISGGQPRFLWSQDGSAAIDVRSSVNYPLVDGTAGWVRVTLDVDNGSGGNDVRFYTSVDGITWTQLGTTRTNAAITGVTSIFDSTTAVGIGGLQPVGANPLAGTIYYAEVRNGIDGPVVARFDSSRVQASGAATPATIDGWTWNGTGLYKRDDYVRLPGAAGNYLSFPDTVANSVTGDIDLRWHGSLDSWVGAAGPTLQSFIGKWGSSGNFSYLFSLQGNGTTGLLQFNWSPNGTTNNQQVTSTISIANGVVFWVRVTFAVATGALNFYTSPDGVTWANVGTFTLGATSIFDSTTPVTVGAYASGASGLGAGNHYYAEVRNGINGPVVASFNGADNQVQTPWTINGSAWNWEGASFTGKPGIALSLPGTAGNYVSTPDTAGNSIVGDIDIRAKALVTNWAADGYFVAKFDAAGRRSYLFRAHVGDAKLIFVTSIDGTATTVNASSSVGVPFANATTGWVRVTHQVNNGSTQNVTTFYTSTDGVVWTPLGTAVTNAGVNAIFDSAALVTIGAGTDAGSGAPLAGTVYYAEVRNGIDGPIVAKFDPTNMAKTGTRTPTTTVQPGGTPNMLTPNQASIETDATGWANNFNTTLAQSAAQALDGLNSLAVTTTGTFASAKTATMAPAIAGKLYTAVASYRAATVGRSGETRITFRDAAGTAISSTAVTGNATNTTGWTSHAVSAVAPAGTAQITVLVIVDSLGAAGVGEVHYVDRISLVEAAEVWTMNGSAWDLIAA